MMEQEGNAAFVKRMRAALTSERTISRNQGARLCDLAAAHAELARLRDALSYFADDENWGKITHYGMYGTPLETFIIWKRLCWSSPAQFAREALEPEEKEQK